MATHLKSTLKETSKLDDILTNFAHFEYLFKVRKENKSKYFFKTHFGKKKHKHETILLLLCKTILSQENNLRTLNCEIA